MSSYRHSLTRMITPVGVACVAVALFGCVAVYNATYHLDAPFMFLTRQIAWLLVAVIGLVVATAIPFSQHRRLLPIYCTAAYIPLVLVLFIGVRVNGMRGWFSLGGVFFQPSEMAKPAFILSLAWVLEATKWERSSFIRGFLPAAAVLGVWSLPVLLQPDFGALLVYGSAFVLVYVCAGGKLKHLAVLGLSLLPVVLWIMASHPYVMERLKGFLNPARYPDSYGWHILQFRRSLASGGLLGQSWGKGVWSQTYLPLGYSDSIFATLGESIGFVGLVPFVALVVGWAVYGYRKVKRCHCVFSVAVLLGLVGYLCIQSFVHLSVNLGLIPPTGITLPLISYGGSSLLSTAIAIGIVESLVRNNREAALNSATAEQQPEEEQ